MLTIIVPGVNPQKLIFQRYGGHLISFEHHEFKASMTIVLFKTELAQNLRVWELLCELADKLRVLDQAFFSDGSGDEAHSILITRFEDKITFDFFGADMKDATPRHAINFEIPGQGGHYNNICAIPAHLGQSDFYYDLYQTLNQIEQLNQEIVIQR